MELKEGDVDKIQAILYFIGNSYQVSSESIAERAGLELQDAIRLCVVLLNHNAITTRGSMFSRNSNTRNYYDAGYFEFVYKKQEKEREEQDEESRARQITIRNGRWAFPLSIISIAGMLATLVLSIFGVI